MVKERWDNMLDVDFEDEIDVKGETEPVEVTAEGSVDSNSNITDLRVTSIYCHSLKKNVKFDTLNFKDSKRILEKAQIEILKKYQEEDYENTVEYDDANDFLSLDNADDSEVERIISNKEHPYKH